MTSRIPNLAKVYTDLLATGWMTVDNRGMVNTIKAVNDDGTYSTVPTEIGGKRLALPTEEVLSGRLGDTIEVFHPLCELVTKGESPVLAKLRRSYGIRLNLVLNLLFFELLALAANRDMHEKLNPDQAQVLSLLKKVDADNVLLWSRVVESLKKTVPIETQLVGLYIKKGASLNGKDYLSGTIVYFDMYRKMATLVDNWSKLGEKDRLLFGVKVGLDDLKAWLLLYKFMLPAVDKDHGYSRGSDSDVAPRLDSLCSSVAELIGDLGAVYESYKDILSYETVKMCKIDAEWEAAFKDLGALRSEIRLVPAQALSISERPPVAAAPAPVAAPMAAPAPMVEQPRQAPQLNEQPDASGHVPFSQRLAQAQYAEQPRQDPNRPATASATAEFFRRIDEARVGSMGYGQPAGYPQPVQRSPNSWGGDWTPDGVIHRNGFQPQLVHNSAVHSIPVNHGMPVQQQSQGFYSYNGL